MMLQALPRGPALTSAVRAPFKQQFSTSAAAALATPKTAAPGGFAVSSQPRITYTHAPPTESATLHLKTGQKFTGKSFGAPKPVRFGETVFSTSITSYTESLTDPSYQGQLLTFTQPLIGNYGVPSNFARHDPSGHPADVNVGSYMESVGVQAAGVICSNLSERFSHFDATESLSTWLARHGVPGLTGIDTRALTTLLRTQGSTLGAIKIGKDHLVPPSAEDFSDPMAENLIAKVSTKQPYTVHPQGGPSAAKVRVALLDFGSKANILRHLLRRGASVTVLPWDYDFSKVQHGFDGLFLSNGPGDPHSIPQSIQTVRKAIAEFNRPIFGICMGHQIIGLAAGIPAYRMKFGNRGHNQPVVAMATHGKSVRAGRVYITSQNHGFALKWEESAKTLEEGKWPEGWEPWFVNANDGSIEGIRLSPKVDRETVWAVQFHPEHAGGPEDCAEMFTDYIDECIAARAKHGAPPADFEVPAALSTPPGTGLTPELTSMIP